MEADEGPFEGVPQQLLDPLPRSTSLYVPRISSADRVRHLTGYAPFIRFVEECGGSASALAADVSALIAFARLQSGDLLADPDLLRAGGIFFGNALVRRAPAAMWEWPAEWSIEVRQREGGPSFPVERVFPALLTADSDRLAQFEEVLKDWDETEAVARDAERRLTLRRDTRWAPVPFAAPPETLRRRPPLNG